MKDRGILKVVDGERAEDRRALGATVSELYAAFKNRELSPGGPDICTTCCASPEVKMRIASTPTQSITFDDLSEFHSAAKGEGAGEDMAYLLPRTMEFMSWGREPCSVGAFSLFAHYFPPVWPELTDRQREAVMHFTATLMRWRLALPDDAGCEFEPVCIIEMCASGGFEIGPTMEVLTQPPPTAARALAYLLLYGGDFWRRDGKGFYAVSKERADALSGALRKALSSPGVLALLEKTALSDDPGRLAGEASWAYDIAEQMHTEAGSFGYL